MNKKFAAFFSLIIILAFIGFIIYDTSSSEDTSEGILSHEGELPDKWALEDEIQSDDGDLTAVALNPNGNIYLGGESFLSCYDSSQNKIWSNRMAGRVTAMTFYGDTIYCSTNESIFLYSTDGKYLDQWGPFEDNSIITSIASNKRYVTFADAGSKMVFVLGKDGRVSSTFGQSGEKFIIPSPYFDVSIDEKNIIHIANTGNRRIETRSIEGDLISYFGSPGTAPGSFCGCCNPAHFVNTSNGFITAEKGINRITILDQDGNFVEFVSSKNKFTPSIPLDIASIDGRTIYAANPSDSKLYIFKRK